MAKKYNPNAFITESGFLIRWVEASRLRETARLMDCRSEDSVLDVGCGAGNLFPYLKVRKVVGVDLSDTLLAQARSRIPSDRDISVVKANAEKLDFPDNSFERVVCSEVMEHVRDPRQVLNEIYRISKPQARVVITVPNEDLINFTKRFILALGIKKWIQGKYPMSDNMLEEWHVNEISPEWIMAEAKTRFVLRQEIGVPFSPLAYHRLFAFDVLKDEQPRT